MDKEQFGKLLMTLRKRKGMCQKELADMLSVSTSAVSKWENGKNLPDMMMLKKIADIFQISCDDLHNPEETLVKLVNSEYQTEEVKEEGEQDEDKETDLKQANAKHKVIINVAIITGILIIAMSMYLFYMSSREPHIQQVCTRYIDDPAWGKVYEIAYVVDVEMTNDSINVHLDEVRDALNQEAIGTNIVKATYYDSKEEALAWKENDVGGYVFLSVE